MWAADWKIPKEGVYVREVRLMLARTESWGEGIHMKGPNWQKHGGGNK